MDGWNIKFNKKDYLCVKRATEKDPELRDLMFQGIRRLRERTNDTMYAEFCLTGEKRCAFHTKEGPVPAPTGVRRGNSARGVQDLSETGQLYACGEGVLPVSLL